MSKSSAKCVESIHIDFNKRQISFKIVPKDGKSIDNIEKILNLDERFEAINQRLSLHAEHKTDRELIKLSAILRNVILTDINTERQEIVFNFSDSLELFDVEELDE